MLLLEAIILSVIAASTPLLLAAAGELVVERSGVLNLGVEGMMIMGAACGFAGAYFTGSTLLGALLGIVAGAAMAAMFGALTLGLAVNQVATGLALTILGIGLSGLIGSGFVGERITPAPALYIPGLTTLPFVGRILFGQDGFVYFSLALVAGIWWFLYKSRAGLVLRAIGDNHTSAHALGYPVLKIRMLAVLFGGGCAGLDRGARLDHARAGGVRVLAAGPADRRRLSVRRGEHPATARPGRRIRHPLATDVVASVSRDRHRPHPDFAHARHRRVSRACVTGSGVRAGPLTTPDARADGACAVGAFDRPV
jgi:hypothetical protein